MMWGGSDEPCALCQCASLGAINLQNNKAVCKDICGLLSEAPFGIKPDRTYVEFRDVPRENMVRTAPTSALFHFFHDEDFGAMQRPRGQVLTAALSGLRLQDVRRLSAQTLGSCSSRTHPLLHWMLEACILHPFR
jgi:hypothetical protein